MQPTLYCSVDRAQCNFKCESLSNDRDDRIYKRFVLTAVTENETIMFVISCPNKQ